MKHAHARRSRKVSSRKRRSQKTYGKTRKQKGGDMWGMGEKNKRPKAPCEGPIHPILGCPSSDCYKDTQRGMCYTKWGWKPKH